MKRWPTAVPLVLVGICSGPCKVYNAAGSGLDLSSGKRRRIIMGGLSIWHILIVAMIAVLLFGGRGKISELMGDFAKGIKSFREGMSDSNDADRPRAPLADQRRDETLVNKDQTVGR